MNRKLAFWATISYALVVRFKGLSTGLPLHTLYGENDTLQMLLLMMRTGDLNPHQFVYPGLAYYIYLPFFYMFYGVGHVIGFFPTLASVSESSFLFVGRCVCAALGTASVYLVYRIGKFFSETTALIAMAVMAAVPQHTEFSHMLRPEIPAIFFALIAQWAALSILDSPKRKTFWILGIAAGASFSTKYNIGLPLILTMAVTFVIAAKQIRWYWPIESAIVFLLVFAATNPFLVANPASILYWMRRVDALYNPAEDYYARNIVFYYLEFLTRYDYNLPLILAALIGIVLLPLTSRARGTLVLIYPLAVFIWLCTFDARRIQSLLPLHPYLALLSACTLHALWRLTRKISASPVFSATYAILLAAILFFPYYRSNIQTYLFSKLDNRSKAELWMTNRLPQGARVALLEFNQIELDPTYFQIQSFAPRDYVDQKDFNWFFQQGFDYVIVSSGQYMRYFVEGQNAQKYRDYFLKFFQDAGQKGTLVLDLATHPTEIPDYRIKVYSTQKLHVPPSFFPSIDTEPGNAQYHLEKSDAYLELQPGYYSLAIPPKTDQNNFIRVRNLKLNELILRRVPDSGLSAEEAVSLFPFAIFPARLRSRFSCSPIPIHKFHRDRSYNSVGLESLVGSI